PSGRGRPRSTLRNAGVPPAGPAASRRRASPNPRPISQPRLRWIPANIRNGIDILPLVANQSIKVLRLPNRTASNPVRAKRLPRMQHSSELLAALQLEDDMHMIRHHAPRVENVATPIEVLQRSRDDAAVLP